MKVIFSRVWFAGPPIRERVRTPNGSLRRVDPGREIVAGQMYLQFARIAGPKVAAPPLMLHGGGTTGPTFGTHSAHADRTDAPQGQILPMHSAKDLDAAGPHPALRRGLRALWAESKLCLPSK
jgi:hypothetical protein